MLLGRLATAPVRWCRQRPSVPPVRRPPQSTQAEASPGRARRLAARLSIELGAVSTEYGLVLILIAIAIIAAATAFGLAVSGLFDRGASEVGSV